MIKVTIQNRIYKITTNKKTYTINAPNTVTLLAQNIKDYTKMTLDTSPEDADVVPVNGTRNGTLSQLKIALSNIKSYVLGTLFNTSSGHDHDGTDSKKIAASNVDGLADYFDASTGHDHDGTDSKQISASNITGLFDSIYPVGSIYMSVNSTNPGTLFGGTWAAWGAGRVPVGFDSSQSEFDTVEETGGSKTHSHKYGLQYGGFFHDTVLEDDVNSGSLIYDSSGNRKKQRRICR